MQKLDLQAVWWCTWCLFPLVVDGFRGKRCDGTIQDVDLAEDIMVDEETYGYVNSFYYLGDTLDGTDPDAAARLKNEWMKFR